MGMHCKDIDALAQTYLDDELEEHDLRDFEEHVADCSECSDKVGQERKFGDMVRRHLAPPTAPDMFRRRMMLALDSEDARMADERRARRRAMILPAAATFAAAAALAVFVMAESGSATSNNSVTVGQDAIRQHMRRPPVEVAGAQASPWIREHFAPDAVVPRFANADVQFRGARLSRIRDRDAVQLFYDVRGPGVHHEVQVHIMDAAGVELPDERTVVGGRALYIDSNQGHSVVMYRDQQGVLYVFTSDMNRASLVDLVGSSDLLMRVNERMNQR